MLSYFVSSAAFCFCLLEFKLLEAGCTVANGKFDEALSLLQQPEPLSSDDAYMVASMSSAVSKLKTDGSLKENGVGHLSRSGSVSRFGGGSRGPSRQGSMNSLTLEPTEAEIAAKKKKEIADELEKLTRAYADEKQIALKDSMDYNKKNEDTLYEAMVHFNIHALRNYQLDQMPANAVTSPGAAGHGHSEISNNNSRDRDEENGDNSSSLEHLKKALDLLNHAMVSIREERELLEKQAAETTHMALFQCPIPETTLTSLVALSYIALTAAEMTINNMVFIDGLHMQFGGIMNSIESALVHCDPVRPIHKDAEHFHHKPPDEDIFHKHGTRSLRSLSHHDPTLAHHHETPELNKHLTTDYHINTTGEVNSSVSSVNLTRTPVAAEVVTHLQHGNNRAHMDNSHMLITKHHTDVVKSILMLLDYSFAAVHDLSGNSIGEHHHHAPVLHGIHEHHGSLSGASDHSSHQHRGSVSVDGIDDDHSLQIQPLYDTIVADYAVDSYRSVVALLLGGYDDAANHVAHTLKRRFGHIVPARLGGKKKIVVVLNGKLKAEEAASASSAYTCKDGQGLASYHDLFENTTVRAEVFPVGTLVENKQKSSDEIIMAQIASNGNIGKPIVTNSLGVEEISYWLQWALLITDVPGYGFMTYSNHQMDNNLDHLTVDAVREVFINIQNVYNEICNNSSIYAASIATVLNNNLSTAVHDPLAKTGDKDLNTPKFSNTSPNTYIGMKLIYVAALCKVAVYIDAAAELGLYVKEFHQLAETLNDAAFLALSYRFMLDLDEYEYSRKVVAQQFAYNKAHPPVAAAAPVAVPILSATERELLTPGATSRHQLAPPPEPYKPVVRPLGELQTVLKNTKKYRFYAQHTNDHHMKRDAVKRLMNVYMDVHQTHVSLAKRKRHYDDEDHHRGNSVETELKGMTVDAIDRKEQIDASWLGKIAHARSKAMYAQYKEFSIVLSAPPSQSSALLSRLMEINHNERAPIQF